MVIIGFTVGLVFLLIYQNSNDLQENSNDESGDVLADQSTNFSDEAMELYDLLSDHFTNGTLTKVAVCRNTWSITMERSSGSEEFLIVDGVVYSISNPIQDSDHLTYLKSLVTNYRDCLQDSLDDLEAGGTGESLFLSDEEIRFINEKLNS